jgi:hypothetical protein
MLSSFLRHELSGRTETPAAPIKEVFRKERRDKGLLKLLMVKFLGWLIFKIEV